MTTFGLISDIHQDHFNNQYVHSPVEGVDVMLVAGDLQEGVGIESLVPYIEAGQRVVYVAGNHEYYSHELVSTRQRIRDHAKLAGVDFLDEDTVIINNVRIVGATLWSDFRLYGDAEEWLVMKICRQGMNDFDCIKIAQREAMLDYKMRFAPSDAARIHKFNLGYIGRILREPHDGPTIVITHHLPSMASVPVHYKHDRLSGGYASNLDNFVLEHKPNVWVHGHTHSACDYMLGDTRVICNPRGYFGENLPQYEPFRFTL